MATKWTEASVGRTVVHSVFKGAVLAVPCCSWAGHEADLLVITRDLKLIDVEVKISRADLRADLQKDKWWKRRPWSRRNSPLERREWPPKIWKHYYAVPAEIWTPQLFDDIPANSGVMLLHRAYERKRRVTSIGSVEMARKAIPNRQADRISGADAVDIARLASLRMWDALAAKESHEETDTQTAGSV